MINKLKTIIKSKFFFYTFFSIIFLIIVGMAIYVNYTIQQKTEESLQQSEEKLSQISENIAVYLSQVEEFTIKLSTLPSINPILHSTSKSDISDFIDLKNDLNKFHISFADFNSVAVSFNMTNTVYSSDLGLYDLNNYYDKELINEINKNELSSYWIFNRNINETYSSKLYNVPITFVRKIPIFSSYALGSIIVNLDNQFLSNAVINFNNKKLKNILIFHGNKLIYCSNSNLLENIDYDTPNVILAKKVKIGTSTYLPSSITDYAYDLTYISLNIPSSISQLSGSFGKNLVLSFIAFLVAGFIFSLIIVYWMINPILAIVSKIKTNESLPVIDTSEKNHYKLINNVLDDLINTNTKIQNIIDENKKSLKDKFLLDMIWGSSYDEENIKEHIVELGFNFSEKYFYVFIVEITYLDEIRNYKFKEQVRLYIKEIIMNQFPKYGNIYGTLIEDNKIVFIVNTNLILEESSDLKELCNLLYDSILHELKMSILFSFGSKELSIMNAYKSYSYSRNLLLYLSEYDREPYAFYTHEIDFTAYNKLSHKPIIENLVNHNFSTINDNLSNTMKSLLNYEASLNHTKKTVIMYVTSIYLELLENNIIISPEILNTSLVTIISSTDVQGLSDAINKYISDIIFQLSNEDRIITDKNISTAIKYITQNYNKDISVADIADSTHLNNIYLNRLFKNATGKTLSDYLNYYRINASKDLLKNTSKSIAEISLEIGYNDTRSFVRFFKKFEGKTPSEFRS